MLSESKARSFNPDIVLFDNWYASIDDLKAMAVLMELANPIEEEQVSEPDNTEMCKFKR